MITLVGSCSPSVLVSGVNKNSSSHYHDLAKVFLLKLYFSLKAFELALLTHKVRSGSAAVLSANSHGLLSGLHVHDSLLLGMKIVPPSRTLE